MAIPISEPEIEAAEAELAAATSGINNLNNSTTNNSYRARRIAARNRARLRAHNNPSLTSFETVDSNNNTTYYTYPNLQNLQNPVQESSPLSPIHRGNNTLSNQPETYHHEMSFLQQLLHELWNVWQPFSSRRSTPSAISTPSQNTIDNQTQPPPSPSSTNLNSFSSYLPSLPLPDLIQCSVDLVVDASVNTSSIDEDSFDEEAEEAIDEVDSDWSLDVELKVSAALKWRQTGRDLRRIADQFTLENAHRSRRRMRNCPNNSRFEFRMALKVAALPAIALVGLGINFFRRN